MTRGNGGLFGGLFDFNGDGKTDGGELFIAYKIYEAVMRAYDEDGGDGGETED